MDHVQFLLELAKLIVTIVGAIFVAWYWNRKKDRLERYQYLDESYNEILRAYFDHPMFGDKALTSRYVDAYKDLDPWRYHFFAMRVHTFLESIFDLSPEAVLDQTKCDPGEGKHAFIVPHHSILSRQTALRSRMQFLRSTAQMHQNRQEQRAASK